jgi:hypothetical protein
MRSWMRLEMNFSNTFFEALMRLIGSPAEAKSSASIEGGHVDAQHNVDAFRAQITFLQTFLRTGEADDNQGQRQSVQNRQERLGENGPAWRKFRRADCRR